MTAPTIETVDAIGLSTPLEERFGYAQDWVDSRSAVLVRVEASDGTVGWGECWGPVSGTVETVEDVLAPTLRGRDATAAERHYERLVETGRATYQTIVPYPAISGLDIALWDLRGKLTDRSVAAMLGGRRHDAATAYATGHYFRDTTALDAQIDAIVAEAEANAETFDAIKLKTGLDFVGHGPDADVELVRSVRQAVAPDTTLLVDANYAYDRATAEDVGQALAAEGVYWFEEPVHPEGIEDYAALRESLPLRIAGGECHAPPAFRRLLAAGGVDVAQPDVCIVGGLTPASRLATRAREAGVEVVPHAWGTPVGLAASLHLIATLPGDPWLELDRSPNPLRDALWDASDLERDGDRVPIPDGPGLGIEPDLDAVASMRVGQ
jgi:D-galactarolactone cycloisomerase